MPRRSRGRTPFGRRLERAAEKHLGQNFSRCSGRHTRQLFPTTAGWHKIAEAGEAGSPCLGFCLLWRFGRKVRCESLFSIEDFATAVHFRNRFGTILLPLLATILQLERVDFLRCALGHRYSTEEAADSGLLVHW